MSGRVLPLLPELAPTLYVHGVPLELERAIPAYRGGANNIQLTVTRVDIGTKRTGPLPRWYPALEVMVVGGRVPNERPFRIGPPSREYRTPEAAARALDRWVSGLILVGEIMAGWRAADPMKGA